MCFQKSTPLDDVKYIFPKSKESSSVGLCSGRNKSYGWYEGKSPGSLVPLPGLGAQTKLVKPTTTIEGLRESLVWEPEGD